MDAVIVLRNVLSTSQVQRLRSYPFSDHHDDDGHGGGDAVSFDWVADAILRRLPALRVGTQVARAVHPAMKLYRLHGDAGVVPPHTDDDFDGANGTRALYSALVRLSEYEGGETLFRGVWGPCLGVGDALVFKHDLLHEGLPVTRGEKIVLKADIMFGAAHDS